MMITCPKCRKQSPADAAFCGFCGAAMQEDEAPAGAKTVFGYGVDDDKLKSAIKEADEPAPPAEPEPAPAPAPAADVANTVPLNATSGLVDGKYELGEVIERLQVGDLYATRNQETGDEDALLMVDASVFPSPLDLERARRELKQMTKLNSDHIVKVKEYGKVGTDRLYIVMDRAPLTSLETLASPGPFSLAEAQYVIKCVGAGLSEAQKRGVIHRDIAPHNIVLDRDGVIKVRGFGVAPVIKRQVIGTPEYLSPEQAKGRPVDQRSNIYNLGALLYFMLAGEPPFTGASPDELLQKHQNEDPEPLATRKPNLELPDKAGALILKALAKSSSRRHLTLRQFLREAESLMPLNEGKVQQALKSRIDGGSGDATELALTTVQATVDVGAATLMDMAPVPPPDEMNTAPMESVPPAEETMAEAPGSMDAARTLMDQKPVVVDEPAVEDASPVPVEEPPPAPVEEPPPPVVDEPPAPPPVEEPPPPVVEPPPPVVEPPPAEKPFQEPAELTRSVQEGPLAAGEVKADDTMLKKPEPVVKKDRSSFKEPVAKPKQAGFRETLWFVKGKEESENVEKGEGEEAPIAAVEPDAVELSEKYKEDGTIGAEGAHELSLRTGKTQQMKKIEIPSGEIPGETMDADEFISEMNRGRTIKIWVVVFLVLAAISGVVVYQLTRPEVPKAKPKVEKKQPAAEDPETKAPETKAPETKAPETKGADPKADPKAEGKPDPRAEPKK